MGTLDKVKGLVENPPKEYRSAPFWGWNDRLQKENLGEQIEGFKKAGMGGFFIHSREGLETEYLSTEWMEDVLSKIYSYRNGKGNLEELLPHLWRKNQTCVK